MEETNRTFVTLREPRNLGEGAYSVTILANELARDGVGVDVDGIDFSNYEKNPVVLYAHDFAGRTESAGLPIGRTTRIVRTGDGQLRAEFEFLEGDPFAQRVRNAWDRGFLRSASIGWRTLESRPTERGVRATKSELLEWSIVAVPADPDAVRDAYREVVTAMIEDADPDLSETERLLDDWRTAVEERGTMSEERENRL